LWYNIYIKKQNENEENNIINEDYCDDNYTKNEINYNFSDKYQYKGLKGREIIRKLSKTLFFFKQSISKKNASRLWY
jgi:hypothetical protein